MKQPIISKTLGSASDLTLMMPIKQGMVQAYEAVSYQTRLTILLRTLNSLRAATREQLLAPAYTDPVERIEQIHSFRLAITTDQPSQLILAVTFDHHWEPYMRVIWRDLGAMLDPILCNVEDYPCAVSSDYETFVKWVRAQQQSTEYFFNATSLTVGDLNYLMQTERALRDGQAATATDLAIARFSALTPQMQLAEARRTGPVVQGEMLRQGISALRGLFALTRYYGADPQMTMDDSGKNVPNDAMLLLRGAQSIMESFESKKLPEQMRAQLAGPLAWYEQELRPSRKPPECPKFGKANIQKGILTAFDKPDARVTHGALLMLDVIDGAKARDWLANFPVSSEADGIPEDGVFRNVAVGFNGLRRLGINREWRDAYPQEFKEGSQARAPQLGDLRGFHPRNWKLPQRNWPKAGGGEIQPEAIDIVIQLRICAPGNNEHELTAGHPLYDMVKKIGDDDSGLRLAGVQSMLTASADNDTDHFGIRDGISQPIPGGAPGGETYWSDSVPLSELVLGQPSARGIVIGADDIRNGGTFLVIRKMRQHRNRFDFLLTRASRESHVSPDGLAAKLIGREKDGTPLLPHVDINDFDYRSDPQGAKCPLQSHVRRANPRSSDAQGQKPPRLMRRGMSYGKRVTNDDNASERGIMFMAYCASIAEQYEVVQRWVNGGNSTRIGSFHADPLMGVPRMGDPRTFRFENAGKVDRVALNTDDRPPVELEWTGYFFTPALNVLKNLEPFTRPEKQRPPEPSELGEKLIEQLQDLEKLAPAKAPGQWQAVLDDAGVRSTGITASVWAAIRTKHQGALTCPYGDLHAENKVMLVADKAGFERVLQDERDNYTVSGYDDRCRGTIGPIYLGYDEDNKLYAKEARPANDAIGRIDFRQAFELAFAKGRETLAEICGAAPDGRASILLPTDYVDIVLAKLCPEYFDVPDEQGFIVPGHLDWRPVGTIDDGMRKPHCPGDYYSPSRYIFEPTPSAVGKHFGEKHGQALRDATKKLHKSGHVFTGRISNLLYAHFKESDVFSRVHAGVMMGFLPTVAGNMMGIFSEWLASGNFWRYQALLLGNTPIAPTGRAAQSVEPNPFCAKWAKAVLDTPLKQAMQQRPAPDFIWRTAKQRSAIVEGSKKYVNKNQVVALSIFSVMQEAAEKEKTDMPNTGPDISAIFGGDRGQPDHPQHACPGYEMALGTMIGAMAALMTDCVIRPLAGELLVEISARN